jgi:cellulose synthase/poly-beta-1,6-N-acetylglucosamine synthase-like glycosyltransferase
MKVSLISTVKDAGPAIGEFLRSVAAQTRPPDETVIVDGGSTDGTLQALRAEPSITALSVPGANISRGRNVALDAAIYEVIAVTDADCVLAPDWLERLLVPLERGEADVSAGFYRPLATTFVQRCFAATNMPEPEELRPGWLPSSRSVAFRREALDEAGGYPEWLPVGEDMFLNHRLLDLGLRIELAPDAVVYWRVRPTVGATWRQYARYARGDAVAAMYPRRHGARFAAYGLASVALATRSRPLLAASALGGVLYVRRPLTRAWRQFEARPTERIAAMAAVPAAMVLIDSAKLAGYASGHALRLRRALQSRSTPSRRAAFPARIDRRASSERSSSANSANHRSSGMNG